MHDGRAPSFAPDYAQFVEQKLGPIAIAVASVDEDHNKREEMQLKDKEESERAEIDQKIERTRMEKKKKFVENEQQQQFDLDDSIAREMLSNIPDNVLILRGEPGPSTRGGCRTRIAQIVGADQLAGIFV